MGSELDDLVIGNAILRKEDQFAPLAATAPRGDALVPARLLDCLAGPGKPGEFPLERVANGFHSITTGTIFPDLHGVPSLLAGAALAGDKVTPAIKAFYEENPFPNYEGVQDYGELVNRGRANSFAKALLDTIGYNKLILECGCGTGQLSHFLSLNNNYVLGVDLSASSLKLAIEHKRRNNLSRSAFVQMNIFELGVKDQAFDVVVSTGVLHHTRDARRAFQTIVRKAKPGGLVIVGLYNWFARVPTFARSKLIGLLGPEIDYVARNRIRDRRKAEIWIKDQYYNPHETWHSVDEVLGWFAENKLVLLGLQPAVIGSNNANSNGAFASGLGTKMTRVLTQLSWLGTIASEGALFVMLGRRMP